MLHVGKPAKLKFDQILAVLQDINVNSGYYKQYLACGTDFYPHKMMGIIRPKYAKAQTTCVLGGLV